MPSEIESTTSSLKILNIKHIENKLAKLEQYEANKYIVCQGNKVDELINKAKNNNENIKDTLKDNFLSIIDREYLPLLDEILSVKVYGRERKILKLELSQKIKKGTIISAIKRQRPNGLYVSEFLVPAKLKLFHEVRLFAKTIPETIESVFTKNGLTYYKNKVSRQIGIVENNESFFLMKTKLTA